MHRGGADWRFAQQGGTRIVRALGAWLREAFGDPPYWEAGCRGTM